MSKSDEETGCGCICVFTFLMGILTWLFLILKWSGAVDWNYLWVLAPLWGTLVFFGWALVCSFCYYLLARR